MRISFHKLLKLNIIQLVVIHQSDICYDILIQIPSIDLILFYLFS